MRNAEYFYNEEKGVVVAVIKDTAGDAVNEFLKRAYQHNMGVNPEVLNRFLIQDQFKGIARCNFDDGDTYDQRIGEDLAFERAMRSYKKAKHKAILRLCDYVSSQVKDIAKITDSKYADK